MIEGQCLCGAVQYRYMGEIQETIICYCLDCQKAQGSLFGFNSPVDRSKFSLLSGEHALQEFFFTANKARVFCQHCGSPIYSYRLDLPNVLRLRLGTVTKGQIPAPREEFFTQHRPDFLCITIEQSE